MTKKIYVQVPTSVVRNEGVFIDNGSFMLYVRLCYLYFRNYKNEEISFSHKVMMQKLFIKDSRTFKKRLNVLFENNLIKNKIEQLPRTKPVTVILNKEILTEKTFTQVNVDIFNYLDQIDEHAFRLLFYYKSHINLDVLDRDFCFVSFRTLQEQLKMGSTTISRANKQLQEKNLIKIERHELETDYSEDDELMFNRWNNHYKLKEIVL